MYIIAAGQNVYRLILLKNPNVQQLFTFNLVKTVSTLTRVVMRRRKAMVTAYSPLGCSIWTNRLPQLPAFIPSALEQKTVVYNTLYSARNSKKTLGSTHSELLKLPHTLSHVGQRVRGKGEEACVVQTGPHLDVEKKKKKKIYKSCV